MNSQYQPNQIDHSLLANEVLRVSPVLIPKISEACDVEDTDVAAVVTEVIRFLNLITYSEQVFSPSQFVDLAWHEFILCTRLYGKSDLAP